VNVIIFGPPGAGKGTQALKIANKFKLHQISTGNLLRKEVKNQTDIGIDFYSKNKNFHEIDGGEKIDEISSKIEQILTV
jgi:adenylate kinase